MLSLCSWRPPSKNPGRNKGPSKEFDWRFEFDRFETCPCFLLSPSAARFQVVLSALDSWWRIDSNGENRIVVLLWQNYTVFGILLA